MHGARRVVIFCLLTAVLPTILLIIPLYLRHNLFADVVYSVAESDILKIEDGISTIFCKEHTLKMNESFNAYQLESEPEVSKRKKHIHLKKSMKLPDDTLEYWGFFLPKGSQMVLTVCSTWSGGRILVVKGDKNLETCGLLDHTKHKEFQLQSAMPKLSNNEEKVWVMFETVAEEIHSNSSYREKLTAKEYRENASNFRNYRSVLGEGNELFFNDAREVENSDGMKTFMLVRKLAKEYLDNHRGRRNEPDLKTPEEILLGHRLRHARQKSSGKKSIGVSNSIIEERIRREEEVKAEEARKKRNIFSDSLHDLDITKVAHGGNAFNFTNDDSSTSSFETNLLTCYDGQILFNHMVPASDQCLNTSFLTSTGAKIMTTMHNVSVDGYYYYIFYSDNDDISNYIAVTFDIFKPTYQYSNFSKHCANQTECSFSLAFFSSQQVIVEIPTRNGIDHEGVDITQLISICQPRMSVYIVFPILVLFLILGCAFL